MKKIFLLGLTLTFTTISIISCSEESTTEQNIDNTKNSITDRTDFENGSYEKLSLNSNEFLESKAWLDNNSFFKNKFSCNELYNVTSNINNKSYIGLDLSIEGANLEGYKIKNYVIIHKLSNNKKFIYLQRDIIKDNSQIVQFLDITTGDVMEYFLYNCSEDDYTNYQGKADASSGGGGPKHVCYKSFNSCYNKTKAGLVQSPIDEVMCDWLPCATMAYSFCALAYVDGYIATASDFNPGDCTKII